MKVKIAYLFSKNKQIGSKLIVWTTKHLHNIDNTPSHVAMLINERWVIEAIAFKGVRVITYKKWLEINQELQKIQKTGPEIEYKKIKKIFKSIKGKKYDWIGVCYLGIFLLLNKITSSQIPKKNKWENSEKYFCCEGVARLEESRNYSMKAPVDLMLDFKKIHK